MLDDAAKRAMRERARASTRLTILEVLSAAPAFDHMMQGTEASSTALLAELYKQLERQQEPDGTSDVVQCSCGAKVRLPGAKPARCGSCKRRLQ